MADPIRKVVVVSDIHCGSVVGLLPPGFVTGEGNSIGQNLIQQWLWYCWMEEATKIIPAFVAGEPWALIVNGDAIEGVHHGGKEIWSTDAADHVEAAKMALQRLWGDDKPEAIYVLEGTECHTGTKEHSLGGSIGAKSFDNNGRQWFSWPSLRVKFNDVLCSFNHHIPATSRVHLEASALSIALANEQSECIRAGHEVPRIVARGHRHRAGEYNDGRNACFVTGAWQALTRHGRKVVTAALPKPSIAKLHFAGESGAMPKLTNMTYLPAEAPAEVL